MKCPSLIAENRKKYPFFKNLDDCKLKITTQITFFFKIEKDIKNCKKNWTSVSMKYYIRHVL